MGIIDMYLYIYLTINILINRALKKDIILDRIISKPIILYKYTHAIGIAPGY